MALEQTELSDPEMNYAKLCIENKQLQELLNFLGKNSKMLHTKLTLKQIKKLVEYANEKNSSDEIKEYLKKIKDYLKKASSDEINDTKLSEVTMDYLKKCIKNKNFQKLGSFLGKPTNDINPELTFEQIKELVAYARKKIPSEKKIIGYLEVIRLQLDAAHVKSSMLKSSIQKSSLSDEEDDEKKKSIFDNQPQDPLTMLKKYIKDGNIVQLDKCIKENKVNSDGLAVLISFACTNNSSGEIINFLLNKKEEFEIDKKCKISDMQKKMQNLKLSKQQEEEKFEEYKVDEKEMKPKAQPKPKFTESGLLPTVIKVGATAHTEKTSWAEGFAKQGMMTEKEAKEVDELHKKSKAAGIVLGTAKVLEKGCNQQ